MELCKNGKSLKMGFIIRRKCDGQEVGDVCAVIPVSMMDDTYAWWKYGVNAYLHLHKLPTHPGERNRYTATPTAESSVRHDFVKTELAKRETERQANKAKPRAKRRGHTKVRQPVATFASDCCQICGFPDPQIDWGVKCPHCGHRPD